MSARIVAVIVVTVTSKLLHLFLVELCLSMVMQLRLHYFALLRVLLSLFFLAGTRHQRLISLIHGH